jgi:hypothetical protein
MLGKALSAFLHAVLYQHPITSGRISPVTELSTEVNRSKPYADRAPWESLIMNLLFKALHWDLAGLNFRYGFVTN